MTERSARRQPSISETLVEVRGPVSFIAHRIDDGIVSVRSAISQRLGLQRIVDGLRSDIEYVGRAPYEYISLGVAAVRARFDPWRRIGVEIGSPIYAAAGSLSNRYDGWCEARYVNNIAKMERRQARRAARQAKR